MLNDQKISADTTCTPAIDDCHQDPDANSSQNSDLQHLVRWPWPAVLVAVVKPTLVDISNGIDTPQQIFVSPTTDGLAALEKSELNINVLWLLHPVEDGSSNLRGTRIHEISTWPAISTDELRLTVLHIAGDRLLCVDENNIFEFKKLSSDWNGSGQFKRPKDAEHE